MRDRPALALAFLAALVLGAATGGVSAPAESAPTLALALEATAFPCATEDDGVCLAYDGQVPGPLLDLDVGDEVVVTLFNNVSASLGWLEDSPLKARLAASDVSLHVHGLSTAADMDGIHAVPGTNLVESAAPPGGSFTYRFRAPHAGAWHYHDHVLGPDGAEGAQRGLYGGLLVRAPGEARPDRVLDLHLLDAGANGGHGLGAAVAAGSSFDLLVVGLGDKTWDVTLTAPDGATRALTTAPGLSDRLRVDEAQPGTYRWRATWLGLERVSGEVVAS